MHQLDRIEEALNKLLDDRKVIVTVQTAPVAPVPAVNPDLYFRGDRFEVAHLIAEMFNSLAFDRKIEAIKTHRNLTGLGLKESKEAIETITNRFDRLRKMEEAEKAKAVPNVGDYSTED